MSKLSRNIAITAVSLAALGVGTTGAAIASDGGSQSGSETSTQEPEGKDDQAVQDAACAKVGVDPSATNIDYDDETGACRLDSGDSGTE